MNSLENKEKSAGRGQVLCIVKQLTQENCFVAFSGGVDSSLLLFLALEAAKENHTKVTAVTFDTALHPAADLFAARQVAEQMGASHRILTVDEFSNPKILENPKERCYLCKRQLFERLLELAGEEAVCCVMEGTNGDDEGQYRPGIRAVEELGIRSPLREAHLTKAEVRAWAKELGISVAQRPSVPCMATRLPYGTRITKELLERIEKGEAYVKSLGFQNVRLRVHGEIARLEVDSESVPRAAQKAGDLNRYLKSLGFSYVTLDLAGFCSGSMDRKLENS